MYDALHSSSGFRVLSLDETMKNAMGLSRYETIIPRGYLCSDHLDHRTWCLRPASNSQITANLAMSWLHWHAAQRSTVRLLVVDNARAALYAAMLRSFALDTCHLPMKYESVASNRRSPDSLMLAEIDEQIECASSLELRVSWARRSNIFMTTSATLHFSARTSVRPLLP